MSPKEGGPDETVLSEAKSPEGDSVRISPDVISIVTGIAVQELSLIHI